MTKIFKPTARSKITNGVILLPNVDQRSTWGRRYGDLIGLLTTQRGGDEQVTPAEHMLIRRAAALAVECERLETLFAMGVEDVKERGRNGHMHRLDVHQRLSTALRRLLVTIGLDRRAVPVESLQEYLVRKHANGNNGHVIDDEVVDTDDGANDDERDSSEATE